MSDDKMTSIFRKYIEGKATLDEQKLVDEWYESLSDGKDMTSLSDSERLNMQEEYWVHIKTKIRQTPDEGRNLWPGFLGLAASLAAIVFVSVFYFQPEVRSAAMAERSGNERSYDISNESNVVRKVMLPDSSEVELFPQSRLQLDKNFNVDERKVSLSGQAIFDVARNEDKPFFVYANEVVTEVLGTRFTVTAFPQASSVTVAVKSGKVSVYTQSVKGSGLPQAEKIVLTPNHQAVYERTQHKVSRALVKEPELIISKEEVNGIRFEGESVYTIFNAIEKMYGVEIDFDEELFSKCLITTSVSGDDLYGRIAVICKITGASYTIEGTRIIITGTGCN